jgi:hypothetical protein
VQVYRFQIDKDSGKITLKLQNEITLPKKSCLQKRTLMDTDFLLDESNGLKRMKVDEDLKQ